MAAVEIAPTLFMLNNLARTAAIALSKGRREARRLIEEVVRARKDEDPGVQTMPILHFIQFYVGSLALDSAVQDSELNEAADWIMWSLADEIYDRQDQTLEVGRLLTFIDAPALQAWPDMPITITRWLSNFYYYARRRAAMRNIGESFWGFTRAWVGMLATGPFPPEGAMFAAMALGWASQENEVLAVELTPQIEKMATTEGLPSRSRAILLVALGTGSGKFSSVARHSWAKRALDEHRDAMFPHDRLQMLIEILGHEYCDTLFQEALREIDLIPPRSDTPKPKTISSFRLMDSMPDLGLALATIPLRRNDIVGLVAVLERWYCTDGEHGSLGPTNTIVFAPFYTSGFVALAQGTSHRLDTDPQQALVRLVTATNYFASTSTSIVGVDNSVLHLPARFGVPVEEYAKEFEASLGEAYCPQALMSVMADLPTEGFAQIQLGAKPHPVQAIQVERLGRTWPIMASLQAPLPDRPLRRAVLWSGAGSLSEAMEIACVRSILERSGVTVEVHAPEETTVDEFLAFYRNPMNDIVWVASHGEYDHWAPKNVSIQIGRSDNFIHLDHLLNELPHMEERRLAVLNVCDGARFEELGMLPRIGFATALAGKHQAVISQMWPVKGWAAAAFGALLASRLANGDSFFNAFSSALALTRCPAGELAHRVAVALGDWDELCDRIDRSGDDFENFALARSAAFYQ